MLRNKYSFLYLFGFFPALLLSSMPAIGNFLSFFFTSFIVTLILDNYNIRFDKGKIVEAAAVCSIAFFMTSILFFLVFFKEVTSDILFMIILNFVVIFIGIATGIWVYYLASRKKAHVLNPKVKKGLENIQRSIEKKSKSKRSKGSRRK